MAAKQNVNEKSRGFGITKFFRGVKAEIKRITWPPKEEAKKAEEEKKHQQSSEKRYYVPHLNKSLTMDEMSDEFNKISRPFDYVGDNGITYMFNPWSTKPTEPAY